MTQAEAIRNGWKCPEKHVANDAQIAADWLRKARSDVVALIATYNHFIRERERVRELLHWATNFDYEVSFWDVCQAAGIEPTAARAMLFKGIDLELKELVSG
jgi:uncharacterized protein YjiS (DUF1127 family)